MHLFKQAIRNFFILSLLCFGLSFGTGVAAENSKEFGKFVIHYNAFRSDTLEPEIAKNYNLVRRSNRLIINVAVLEKVMDTTGKPVAAQVTGHASNLTGQLKNLKFREVKEGTAIYYLAEEKFSDGEFLKFDLNINLEGEEKPARIKFEKRFYTH